MDRLGRDLVRTSYLKGDFILRSGKRSNRYFDKFLFETEPNDPGTLALAGVVVLSAAILAGYAPARRASRIDPLVALRHE